MDFIYGKLNKEIEQQVKEYKGVATDYASTLIDNSNNTIAVEVNANKIVNEAKTYTDELAAESKAYVDESTDKLLKDISDLRTDVENIDAKITKISLDFIDTLI